MMYYPSTTTSGSITSSSIWSGWTSNVGATGPVTVSNVWYTWNSAAGTMTGATTTVTNIWSGWAGGTVGPSYPVQVYSPLGHSTPQKSAAEREADEVRWREQQEQYRQRQAEAEKKRLEIEARAHELLLEFLDESQKKEYLAKNYFHLEILDGKTSEVKRYRIEKGFAGNVRRVDASGKILKRYCIHPIERVPDEDCMLTQKLLLETDEEQFLRVANAS